MIGIIAAMQQEADAFLALCENVTQLSESPFTLYKATYHNHDVLLGLSGIGKVSAAAITSALIINHRPDFIINIGSAGGLSHNLKVGDIVVANQCAYHDFDVSAFGHEISFEKGWYVFKANEDLLNIIKDGFKEIHVGPLVCGDQFVSSEEVFKVMTQRFNGVLATDMESTAIAHVASLHKVPWVIARSISDLVFDHDNHVSFDEFLVLASQKSAHFVATLIEHLSK